MMERCPCRVECDGLMVEQENEINEIKEADYSDLQSLLSNLSKFNQNRVFRGKAVKIRALNLNVDKTQSRR